MSNIKSFYQHHFMAVDLIVSILLAVLIWGEHRYLGFIPLITSFSENHQILYGTLASVCGSLLGFVVTAVSIIFSLSTRRVFRVLVDSNHHQTLFTVYFNSVLFLALATIWALVGILFDTKLSPTPWITCTMLGLTVIVMFRIYRCIWILKEMVGITLRSYRSQPTH